MKTNVKRRVRRQTHEGGRAVFQTPEQTLRRLVLANLLWEDQFYVDGESVADQIKDLVATLPTEAVAQLADEARNEHNLRHVPLLLVRELLRRGGDARIGQAVYDVIQRVDEMGELINMVRMEGRNPEDPNDRNPIPKQLLKALKRKFPEFSEYQLAKYKGRNSEFNIRDVFRLVRPKAKDLEQQAVFDRLYHGNLRSPETWENKLSRGEDKRESFEGMLREKKLGGLATLRNLRNMKEAGVPKDLVRGAVMRQAGRSRILPYRYIAAANACPQWADIASDGMIAAMEDMPRLPGRTLVLIDVSGSMVGQPVSSRSEIDRLDAACALGILTRGIADECEVFTFSSKGWFSRRADGIGSGDLQAMPSYDGLALRDRIRQVENNGTELGAALEDLARIRGDFDRIIVFTDEQSADAVGAPAWDKAYMINVASYQNGVTFGDWVGINGFSEATIKYIQALEAE